MDNLSESSILASLKTSFIGRNVLCFPQVSSTMDAARKAGSEGAPDGTLVIAEEQTAGRGRRGRGWLSARGSLTFSVVLRPGMEQLPSLVMIASLAVARAVEAVTSLHPRIKWPNDVLVGGKKLCGILIENDIKGNAVDFAIIGIGLNVNGKPPVLPAAAIPATSLAVEAGKSLSCLEVLSQVLLQIEQLYKNMRQGGNVFDEWRQSLDTLGRQVEVRSDSTVTVGLAQDVAPDGSLLLRLADGTVRRIVAGDVSLRGR